MQARTGQPVTVTVAGRFSAPTGAGPAWRYKCRWLLGAAAADSDPGLTVTVTRRAMMTRMERPAVAKRIRSLFT